MTLCIAAVCDHVKDNISKIVMCVDMQREQEGIGSSETEDKLSYVRKGWPTLCAGTISRSNELVEVYADYLSKHFGQIDEFNLIDHLREPVHIQKKKLVEEYLRQNYTFDWKYFYGDGLKILPDTFITKVGYEIQKIKLDASLIICGFLPQTSYENGEIFQSPFLGLVDVQEDLISDQEYPRILDDFAATGSGGPTALSSLYRREQSPDDSLERTLYNVYEANLLSEEVPGVGKRYIGIYVLDEKGAMSEMTDAGYKNLKKLYAKYGPHQIKKDESLKLEDSFFEPIS